MRTESFWHHNCIEVQAGTSCPRGRDPRWGRRTILRLTDGAGTQWRATIHGRTVEASITVEDPRSIEIELTGGAECDTIVEALRAAADAIEAELAAGVEPDPTEPPTPEEPPSPAPPQAPAPARGDDDGRLVYSELRRLAHDPSCRWAEKIADENFRTVAPAEALEVCARPCRVCTPGVG